MQRLVDAIGIDHYEGIDSRSYIKGIRRGAGRTLQIASGYTGGLNSEAEIVDAVGDVDRGSSDGVHWWMHHPVNQLRDGGDSSTHKMRRDYGTCPECFTQLSSNGACACPV